MPSRVCPFLLWLPLPPLPAIPPSTGPGGLCGPREVAMKTMLLPILALWVGCCPRGALAKQGPSLREPMAAPTPGSLHTLRPPPPSQPRTPDGE